MSVVRLIGFTTLTCGCVVGRYRETATAKDIHYVEEKGPGCVEGTHRRNQALPGRWSYRSALGRVARAAHAS